MRHPGLAAAAQQARSAVDRGVAAVPADALLEVSRQDDEENPCQEPPDDGPEGTTQWVVGKRVFVRAGSDPAELLQRLRSAYPTADGWLPEPVRESPDETTLTTRRGDLTVRIVVGRRGDSPQVVVDATTRCFRNGG